MNTRTQDKSSQSAVRMDMLHGSLLNKILLFSLPLAASSILQQLFNSIDIAVVGKFASAQALAAVGSNSSVISLMINLFVGISGKCRNRKLYRPKRSTRNKKRDTYRFCHRTNKRITTTRCRITRCTPHIKSHGHA